MTNANPHIEVKISRHEQKRALAQQLVRFCLECDKKNEPVHFSVIKIIADVLCAWPEDIPLPTLHARLFVAGSVNSVVFGVSAEGCIDDIKIYCYLIDRCVALEVVPPAHRTKYPWRLTVDPLVVENYDYKHFFTDLWGSL